MPNSQNASSSFTPEEEKIIACVKRRAIVHGAIGGFLVNACIFLLCYLLYMMQHTNKTTEKKDIGIFAGIFTVIELFFIGWAYKSPENFFDYIPKEKIAAYKDAIAGKNTVTEACANREESDETARLSINATSEHQDNACEKSGCWRCCFPFGGKKSSGHSNHAATKHNDINPP